MLGETVCWVTMGQAAIVLQGSCHNADTARQAGSQASWSAALTNPPVWDAMDTAHKGLSLTQHTCILIAKQGGFIK